jgi:eukaryotic-like serine/threonine-protein kinase
MARRTGTEELMSEGRSGSRRRSAAALTVGVGIVVALSAAGCGGSSGSASTTTSTQSAGATSATTAASSTSEATTTATSTSEDNSLPGKWAGQYGGTYSGTFTLHWTQSGTALTGKITLSQAGTLALNGKVNGSHIEFGTVGGPGITYTGTVSGDTMSGHYSTPNGGGTWSAHKA